MDAFIPTIKMKNIEKKLDEFCSVGKLQGYREVLQLIFAKIDDANCNISTREDGGPSVHEFANDKGNCHIRIPLKKYTKNPVAAIWVILHEFGHHLSGSIDKKDLTKAVVIQREIEAWNLARKELASFPILAKNISEFDEFAQKCLDSYLKEETETQMGSQDNDY